MTRKTEVPYIGVRKCPSGRYCAFITNKKIHHRLGIFDTPEQAALAYDAAAISIRGSLAKTNFPVHGCGGGVVEAPNATKQGRKGRRQVRGVRKRVRRNKTRDFLGSFSTPEEAGGSGGGVVKASSEMVEAERVETMLFSDIIHRGLPVDLNEPPPPWL